MKLVYEQTEITPTNTYIKEFTVYAKTEIELDRFSERFVDLLSQEDPWTIEAIGDSNCGDGCEYGFCKWYYVTATKDEIVDRTKEFKALYKAAKKGSNK